MKKKLFIDFCKNNEEKKFLLEEWNYDKNSYIDVNAIKVTSREKVWWICDKGHEWKATVFNRIKQRTCGCPYCTNREVLIGFNDLETREPKISSEWHPTKNGYLRPHHVTVGSTLNVWWQCCRGHEWQARISNRTRKSNTSKGSNCPTCQKSLNASLPEKIIFYYIKKVFNSAISSYKPDFLNLKELDIYIPDLKLGIEYDGQNYHNEDKLERDEDKNNLCLENDITLIRVRELNCPQMKPSNNIEILNQESSNYLQLEENIKKIFNYIEKRYNIHIEEPIINIDSDISEVLELIEKECFENSLEFKFPEIAKEWHPTKNGNLKPNQVSFGVGFKAWWICSEGHEYEATIAKRTREKTNCPYCSNQKVLKGYNDLETHYPEIAREWHPIKNGNLKPSEISSGSNKKIWWKCDKGHEWKTTVAKRIGEKTNCPYCSNKKVLEGYNDLATTHPILVKQWHPTKNGDLTPAQVVTGSNKKVWWICDKGHEWESRVINRTKVNNNNCPYCSNKKVLEGYNDLTTTHPNLAKQWHPTKNGDLTPGKVFAGSNIKVWWMCDKGHEWEAFIYSRALNNCNCPYCCNKKVLEGYNDLTTTHPNLVKQWHSTKNGDLKPTQVVAGSNKKVWWNCDKGHEWEAIISNRARLNRGCPYCSNQKVLKGYNDLETHYPELAKELHPTRNKGLKASEIMYKSTVKIWWLCKNGHEWLASPLSKVAIGQGKCSNCK